MNVRPEFKDMRTCRFCGSPAMLLGKPFSNHDGTRDWWREPVEARCAEHSKGAERRTRNHGEGRTGRTEVYHVRVLTHLCIRNNREDKDGRLSDAPEHRYSCGAIMATDTLRQPVDKLDPRCADEPCERPAVEEFEKVWAR